jgi:lipopolysaccharide/colanic/teichoic acid biosynthesis glycosyltransferase
MLLGPVISCEQKQYYTKVRRTIRILDILFSVALITITLPLQIFIYFLVRLTSPGPGIIRQERLGEDNETFLMWKFRSMRQDAERNGPELSGRHDVRRTYIGRFLRKHRLDELPQLYNVLKGEMSLVGPRPERAEIIEREKLYRRVPGYYERLQVPPGITGWTQVTCGYNPDPYVKHHFDMLFITNYSVKIYLLIILKRFIQNHLTIK